jgi:YfiR/HmsC-like
MGQPSRTVNQLSGQPPGLLIVRPMRGLLRLLFVVSVVLFHAVIPSAVEGQEDTVSEYELKAAMLYNLTRFVEWPPSAYPDPQTPTVLCILGRDPFGVSLTSLTAGRVVNGRLVVIRHVAGGKEVQRCHVLYISSSERKSLVQVFQALKGANVLTVGEMAQFAAHGGMIQFALEEKQVRFQVNLDAAAQADLKISSRLLVLARIVRNQSKDSNDGRSTTGPQEFGMARVRLPTRKQQLARTLRKVELSGIADDECRRSR